MLPPAPLLLQNLSKVLTGIAVGVVHPDTDIFYHRSKAGLTEVRRSGQKNQITICSQIEALELGISGRVVTCQIVHALLAEDEQGVQAT